jgi:hypothetical protein
MFHRLLLVFFRGPRQKIPTFALSRLRPSTHFKGAQFASGKTTTTGGEPSLAGLSTRLGIETPAMEWP